VPPEKDLAAENKKTHCESIFPLSIKKHVHFDEDVVK